MTSQRADPPTTRPSAGTKTRISRTQGDEVAGNGDQAQPAVVDPHDDDHREDPERAPEDLRADDRERVVPRSDVGRHRRRRVDHQDPDRGERDDREEDRVVGRVALAAQDLRALPCAGAGGRASGGAAPVARRAPVAAPRAPGSRRPSGRAAGSSLRGPSGARLDQALHGGLEGPAAGLVVLEHVEARRRGAQEHRPGAARRSRPPRARAGGRRPPRPPASRSERWSRGPASRNRRSSVAPLSPMRTAAWARSAATDASSDEVDALVAAARRSARSGHRRPAGRRSPRPAGCPGSR